MTKNYLIIVEGVADMKFIHDFMLHLFSEIKDVKIPAPLAKRKQESLRRNMESVVKEKKPFLIQILENPNVKILIAGGCATIESNNLQTINEHKDTGFNILMIQDADDSSKDYGTYETRMEYLNAIKKRNSLDFATFLFPNDNDDGDLETLLLQIKNEEKYTTFFDCFKSYVNCTKKYADFTEQELLTNKMLIFNYIQSNQGHDIAGEGNRDYRNSGLWDLDSIHLKKLTDFLRKNIDL